MVLCAYTAVIGYEMPALVYEMLDCYRRETPVKQEFYGSNRKTNSKRDHIKRLSI
ncbi:MAG: hypothetical protein ACP5N0_02935 [Methanosarcina sp.]